MAQNQSQVWLYNKLRSSGMNVGASFDEFRRRIETNEASRKWCWDKAQEFGWNVGADYAEFSRKVSGSILDTPQATEVVSPTTTPTADLSDQTQQVRADAGLNQGNFQGLSTENATPQGTNQSGDSNPYNVPSVAYNASTGQIENVSPQQQQAPAQANAPEFDHDKRLAEIEARREKIKARTKELYRQRDARLNPSNKGKNRGLSVNPNGSAAFGGGYRVYAPTHAQQMADGNMSGSSNNGAGGRPQPEDDEIRDLLAEDIMLDKEARTIRNQEKAKSRNGVQNLLGGAWDAISNPHTWAWGWTDLHYATRLMSASEHMGNLTEAQQNMLEASANLNYTQSQYDDPSVWYSAGNIAGESVPFMVELALTGGGGAIMELGTKGGVRIATKAATKYALNSIEKKMIQYAGTAMIDFGVGLAYANTTGLARTMADYDNRRMGKVYQMADGSYQFGHFEKDANGNNVFVKGGESAGAALWKAEVANALEYYTEILGVHMEGAGGKILGKMQAGAERFGLNRIGAGLGKMIKYGENFSNSAAAKFFKSVGFNGLIGEGMEEEANLVLNALLVGDNKFSDLWNPKQQAEIWLGMAFSTGAIHLVGTGINKGSRTVAYHQTKKKLADAETIARMRLTEEVWKPLQERIDNADNENMGDVVMDIINDPSLHEEEKRAVLEYVRQLVQFRGFNQASMVEAADEAAQSGTDENSDPEEQRTDEQKVTDELEAAYTQGVEDALEPNHVSRRLRHAAEVMTGGQDIAAATTWYQQWLGDKTVAERIQKMRDEGATEEEITHAMEFCKAMSAYQGMQQAIEDEADSQDKARREMARQATHTDGSMRLVTLKDGSQVFIVGGEVLQDSNGVIDRENSSEVISVYDPGSGNRWQTKPSDVVSVDDYMTPDEIEADLQDKKEQTRQALREQADGKINLQPGATVNVGIDDSGNYEQVRVLGTDGTNVSIIDAQGNATVVPMTQLQDMSDAVAEQEFLSIRDTYQEAGDNGQLDADAMLPADSASSTTEEDTPATPSSKPTEAPIAPGSFAKNDEVVVRLADGTEVRGMVSEEPREDGSLEIAYRDGKKMGYVDIKADEIADRIVSHKSSAVPTTTSTAEVDNEQPIVTPTPPATDELIRMARQGDELARHQLESQGIDWHESTTNPAPIVTDNAMPEERADNAHTGGTALSRVPYNKERKDYDYEAVDADTAFDAITEQVSDPNVTTQIANDMVSAIENNIKAEEKKPSTGVDKIAKKLKKLEEGGTQGGTVAERIAFANQKAQAISQKQAELEEAKRASAEKVASMKEQLAKWQEIAGVQARRAAQSQGDTVPKIGESVPNIEESTENAPVSVPNNSESAPITPQTETSRRIAEAIAEAQKEGVAEPTDAQKEAGNYKKAHVKIGNLDISIENPIGSTRSSKDAKGNEWSTTMQNSYGYIRGTESVDGDHIDTFLNDEAFNDDAPVFVIDQTNEDGSFDEHKVMLGFNTKEEAMQAYLNNYDSNWMETHPGIRITETSRDNFGKWIESSHRKTKPFADYAMNQGASVVSTGTAPTAESAPTPTAPIVDNSGAFAGLPDSSLQSMVRNNERELSKLPADSPKREALQRIVDTAKAELAKRAKKDHKQKNSVGKNNPTTGGIERHVEDKNAHEVIELAKAFGRRVVFDGSFIDEQHAGYIDASGVIHINPNMSVDAQMSAIIGHELTHTTEGTEAYARLVEFLRNNDTFKKWLEDQGYDSLEECARAEAKYRLEKKESIEHQAKKERRDLTDEERAELDSLELTEEEAEKEIVADFCGEMVLSDRRFTQEMLSNVKESRSIVERIIEAIRKFIDRLINRNSKADNQTIKDLQTISNMLTDALRESRERENRAEARPRNNVYTYWNQHTTDKKGNKKSGRELLAETMRENGKSKKEINRVLRQMDNLAKLAETLGEGYPQFQFWNETEPVVGDDGVIHLSCVVRNAEYPMNIDFSIICKKKEAATELLDYLVKEGDPSIVKDGKIQLNRDNLRTINNIVKQHGFEMACDLCFVEAKRFGMSTWANSFIDFWNPLVKVAMVAKLKAEGKLPADYNADDFSMGEFNFRGSNEAETALDETEEVSVEILEAMRQAMTEYIAGHPEDMRTKVEPMYDLKKDENGKLVVDESCLFTRRHPVDEDGNEIKGEWEKVYLRKKADGSGFEETGEVADMPDKPALKEYTKVKGKGTLYADKPIVSKMVDLIADPTQGGKARKMLNAADLVSHSGMDGIINKFFDLYKIINIHGGVSKPKSQHGHSPYVSAALTGASGVSFSKEKAFHIGGVRNQSFSDYEAMLWFDYMQLYADMGALGMPMQVYTKEPAYPRLFGMMGSKINLSLLCQSHIPTINLARALYGKKSKSPLQTKVWNYLHDHAGLRPVKGTALEAFSWIKKMEKAIEEMKPKGAMTEEMKTMEALLDRISESDNLDEWDYNWGDQTFPAREAFDIISDPNYSANVGTILVAVSDKMMEKALSDPRIKMVIPYHKSGLPADVALSSGVFLYKDYSKWQTDKKIDKQGKAKEPKINFYDCIKVVEARLNGATVEGVKAFDSKSKNAWHNPEAYSQRVQEVLDMIMPEGHGYTIDDVPVLAGKLFALNAVINDGIMPRFADYVFEHGETGISIDKKASQPHLAGVVTDERGIPKFSEQAETYFKKVEDFNMIATETDENGDVHYKYHPQRAVEFALPERVKVRGEGWTTSALPPINEDTKINVVRDGKLIEMSITDLIDENGEMSLNDFIAAHTSRWENTHGKLRTSLADMASDAYRMKALENEIMNEHPDWADVKLRERNELTAALSRWSSQGGLNFGDTESIAKAKQAIELAIKNGVSLDSFSSADEAIAKLTQEAELKKRKQRNSILGRRGAANLDASEEATTRMDNLGKAREMESEGKDALTIKQATGWERGGDGKWRYEVADASIVAGVQGYLKRSAEAAQNRKTITIRYSSPTIGDLIGIDNAIFKAYPQLADVRITWHHQRFGSEITASYADGRIDITSPYIYYDERNLPTIMHEIQHAIQGYEGFAKGGGFEPGHQMVKAHLDAYRERMMEKLSPFPNDALELQDRIREALETYQDAEYENGINSDEAREAKQRYLELREQFNNLPSLIQWTARKDNIERKIEEERMRLTNKGRMYDGLGGAYQYLGGEVEARNAADRLYMSEEDRNNSLLESTEDVAREDQLFITQNAGKSNFIGKKARAQYEALLEKKRPDLPAEMRQQALDYLHSLEDTKENNRKVKIAMKWLADGTIRLPEDIEKVNDALSVADKAKVDPMSYRSPMELLDAHKEYKPSKKPIDPETVPTLTRAYEVKEHGIVVYDVFDTTEDDIYGDAEYTLEESRQAMREIINTHFGEDCSPWCLLQGDGKGNLTEQSASYWEHYNAIPKQVAFQNGKLIAFRAIDDITPTVEDMDQRISAFLTGEYSDEVLPITYSENYGVEINYDDEDVSHLDKLAKMADELGIDYDMEAFEEYRDWLANDQEGDQPDFDVDELVDSIAEEMKVIGDDEHRDLLYRDYEDFDTDATYGNGVETWWDRQDASHVGIPATIKTEDGWNANVEINPLNGETLKENKRWKGNRQKGSYEEYTDDGGYHIVENRDDEGELHGEQRSEKIYNSDVTAVNISNYEHGVKHGEQLIGLIEDGSDEMRLESREIYDQGKNLMTEEYFRSSGTISSRETRNEDGSLLRETFNADGTLSEMRYAIGVGKALSLRYYEDDVKSISVTDGTGYSASMAFDMNGKAVMYSTPGTIVYISEDGTATAKRLGARGLPMNNAEPITDEEIEKCKSKSERTIRRVAGALSEDVLRQIEAEISSAQSTDDIRFREREGEEPNKTVKVYKMMRMVNGELYPLFIDSASPTKLGVWYDADSPNLDMLKGLPAGNHMVNFATGETMTQEEAVAQHPEWKLKGDQKRPNVDAVNWATENGWRWMEVKDTETKQSRYGENRAYNNYGINGSGSVETYAMRPGWHAGSLPTMRQIGLGQNKDLRDGRFVWVEGRMSADVDYQSQLDAEGKREMVDQVPVDGYYMMATNANKKASQADRVGWYIGGSFVADRVLSDAEAREVIDRWNSDPEHADTQVEYDYGRENERTFDAQGARDEKSKVEVAQALAERLGKKVRIVTDINELKRMPEYKKLSDTKKARMLRSQGWINTATGEIVVVVPNNLDVADIKKTILHEVVGHYGLQQMVGKENFTNFLSEVFKHADADLRAKITDLAKRRGWDFQLATEEFIAGLAERGFDDMNEQERSIWQKIKDLVQKMLDKLMGGEKLGEGVEISENDLRYMLWRSYQMQTSQGVMSQAENVMKQRELGVGAYNEENVRFRDDMFTQRDLINIAYDSARDAINAMGYKRETDLQKLQDARDAVARYIRKALAASNMPALKKMELNKLLSSVKQVRNRGELESHLRKVEGIMWDVDSRMERRAIDKLLGKKLLEKNNDGVSVGKTVDDNTRKVLEAVKSRLATIQKTDVDTELHTLGSEAFNIRKDIEDRFEGFKTWMDAFRQQQEQSKTTEADWDAEYTRLSGLDPATMTEQEQRELAGYRLLLIGAEQKRLKEERERLRAENAVNAQTEVDARMKELEALMNDPAHDFTEEEAGEYGALKLLSMLNEASLMETTRLVDPTTGLTSESIASVNEQRDKLIEEIKDLRKQRAAATSPTDKTSITNMIEQKQGEIVNLDIVENSIKEKQNDLYRQSRWMLGVIIESGHIELKRQIQEEADRRRDIAHEGYEDIKRKGKEWIQYDKSGKRIDLEHRGRMRGFIHNLFGTALDSFDYMAQAISTSQSGQGYIYRRFVEGDEGLVAAHSNHVAAMARAKAMLDEKCNELLGMNFKRTADRYSKVEQSTGIYYYPEDREGNPQRSELPCSKGTAMYLYQLWQMNDGRMKLAKMGFTEESMAQIESFIGANLVDLANWMVTDYYPQLRERMNSRHKELYFTSMAEVQNYVPIHIDRTALKGQSDMAEGGAGSFSESLKKKNGSIVNRTVNVLPIDLSRTAFDVIAEHTDKNEEWIAYARVRQDLDYLLNGIAFRNQLNANSRGRYADFEKACRTAALLPSQSGGGTESAMRMLTAGVVSGAISFKLWTAFKQILSYPAFFGYSQDPIYMLKLVPYFFNFAGNYKWATKNLPSFQKRIEEGLAASSDLVRELNGMSDGAFKRLLSGYSKWGMLPNKFVDAITCAAGARAIFELEYKRAIKNGATAEEAKSVALRKADIAYNETQQSNLGTMKSEAQTSQNFASKMITTFQQSNLGFTRKAVLALNDIIKGIKDQKKQVEIRMEIFGESESKAKKKVWNNTRKGVVNVGLFGFGLKILWDLAPSIFAGIMSGFQNGGDDDGEDEDKTLLEKLLWFGGYLYQGTLGGNIMHDIQGGGSYNPMSILTNSEIKELAKIYDDYGVSPELMAQTLIAMSDVSGVKIDTWANVAIGAQDMVSHGFKSDVAMDVALILNMPKSMRKELMERRVRNYTPMEYAEAMAFAMKKENASSFGHLFKGTTELKPKDMKEYLKEYESRVVTAESQERWDEFLMSAKLVNRRKLKSYKKGLREVGIFGWEPKDPREKMVGKAGEMYSNIESLYNKEMNRPNGFRPEVMERLIQLKMAIRNLSPRIIEGNDVSTEWLVIKIEFKDVKRDIQKDQKLNKKQMDEILVNDFMEQLIETQQN